MALIVTGCAAAQPDGVASSDAAPATGAASTTSGQTGQPTNSVAPATSPRSTTAPTPTGSGTGGSPEVGPNFLQIAALSADGSGHELVLTMDVAADVPPGSPLVGHLAYAFDLDTNGDAAADFHAVLSLLPEGGFAPVLVEVPSGARQDGPAFPGSATLGGRRISMTVHVAALGCPDVVQVRASSEQTKSGATVRASFPAGTGQWISVKTTC